MGFLELRQEPGVYLRVTAGMAIRNSTLFSKSGLLSSNVGHLRNLSKHESIIQMLLEVRWDTKHPFLVSRKILGFLSIFKKSQASSTLKH